MVNDLLLLSGIGGVGWAYSVIAGKLGWPETYNENTERDVPHGEAAFNCLLWAFFFLLLAGVSYCFPIFNTAASAVDHAVDRVDSFMIGAVVGLLIVAGAVLGLGAACSSIYNAWISGNNGNRAVLIIGLTVVILAVSLFHPSAHAAGRAFGRLWLWLWHLA